MSLANLAAGRASDHEYLTPEEERCVTERDLPGSFHTWESEVADRTALDETAASMQDLLGYQEPVPEALVVDFEPMTAAEFKRIVRDLMLIKAERDAVEANSKALVADLDRRRDAILDEWDAQLRHYVDGGHGATSRRCEYGLCGVRKGGGRIFIDDHEEALKSVREMAPSALRETIDLAKLPPHFTAPGFDTTPETSKVYIQPLPKSRRANETEDDDE